MQRVLGGIAVAFLITSSAAAAEPIATADASPQLGAPAAVAPLGAPSPAAAQFDAGPTPPNAPGCSAAAAPTDPDRRPHGEVWGGVGTHGYRDAGGVVTAPVGKCGSVSVMVDRSEGGLGGWRR